MGQLDPCGLASVHDCDSVFAVFRPEYMAALDACGLPATCGPELADVASDDCVAGKVTGLSPTPAQMTLTAEVCSACPAFVDGGACPDSMFFVPGEVLDSGATTSSGAGTSFLYLSDTLIASIEQACLGSSTVGPPKNAGCWAAFYACVSQQVLAAQPADYATACAANPAGP
jgi:hypothetical protein